jgi:acyl carrier protein
MDRQQIIEWTNAVFEEEFEVPAEQLKPEAQLFGELGLDSLDTVDLIVALQKKFRMTIRGDERIREIRSLNDLYNYLESMGKEDPKDL